MSTPQELKDRALREFKIVKADMETLRSERATALNYYFGELFGKEVEGRSKFVSMDLFETIEWIKPTLMRIFYGGQNVVEVSPQGRDDEPKAKLMEEKLNYDFKKQNPGFKILYQFFQDALLHKIGVIKYFWKTGHTFKFRKYKGITTTDIQDLIAKGHIIDKTEIAREAVPGLQEALFNIKCREKKRFSKPVAVNIPLEEIYFRKDMKDREDENGIFIHRPLIHKKKAAKKYGITLEELDAEIENWESEPEKSARFTDIGGVNFLTPDKDSDLVYDNEVYLYDIDEEGNAIPKIVSFIGTGEKEGHIIVQDNEYGKPNFAIISPIIVSHRLCGTSWEEAIKKIQEIRSFLARNIMDNISYQHNGARVVNSSRVHTDELINGLRPNLNIFTKGDQDPSTCIYQLPYTPLAPHTHTMFSQTTTEMKAALTGVNKFGQGLDPKAIIGRTKGGTNQVMTAAQQPIELLARIFAETGVRDLFQGFMDMNLSFFDQETAMQINQDWQNITPDMINGDFDLSIDVGVGTGSKDMIYQQLIGMLNIYSGTAKAIGPQFLTEVADFEKIRNIFRQSWEMLGFKNPDKYVLNEQTVQMIKKGMMNGQQSGSGEGNPGGVGGETGQGVTNYAPMPGGNGQGDMAQISRM